MSESKSLKIDITAESGLEEVNTPIIQGKLDCIIIDSMEIVSITIDSEIGYPIFHNAQHKGIKYYAPRSVLQGWESRLMVHDQFNKFNLNETLNIRVSGPKNAEVSIIFRFN